MARSPETQQRPVGSIFAPKTHPYETYSFKSMGVKKTVKFYVGRDGGVVTAVALDESGEIVGTAEKYRDKDGFGRIFIDLKPLMSLYTGADKNAFRETVRNKFMSGLKKATKRDLSEILVDTNDRPIYRGGGSGGPAIARTLSTTLGHIC